MDMKPSYEELEKRIKQLELLLNNPYQDKEKHDITQLVQAMAIPTFVIDSSHVVTHWNKACEKLTNISSVDVIGTCDAWKAFYPELRPVLADLVVDFTGKENITEYYDNFSQTELVDDGLQAQAFFPLLGKTGKWLYFTATPLKDSSDQIIGAIETFQDITEQINAETHYRLLLKAIPDPVIVYDTQQKITYINEAFELIYGWTSKDLLGGTIDFVPTDEVAKTKEAWRRTLNGEKVFFETKRKTKTGRILDIQMKTAIVNDQNDKHTASIVIHRDVTILKQTENEREHLIGVLEKALSEVKTLSGLLPICASCKKVRDDKGYWNQIELYIQRNSDAKFSHGMCPECSDDFYGDQDWYKKMKKKKGRE
jgi:PAS domain S-box-containing protein